MLSIIECESMYVKMSKCAFGMIELLYLGHIINVEGVRVDLDKIGDIIDWSPSKNIS